MAGSNKHIPFTLAILLSLVVELNGAPLPRGDWVAHGFSGEDREKLRQFLRESVEKKEIPGGAILLMHYGEVIFEEGFGYADMKKKLPFLPTAPCSIASLSKPIVATLIVKLAADGKLDLDKRIDAYLHSFKNVKLQNGRLASRAPTIRECLKHIAGFTPDLPVRVHTQTGEKPGGRPWLRYTHKGLTLAEIVEREAEQGLYGEPGNRFAYSGIGYDVVGRIAEVVTKKNLNSLLQEKICGPLGLKHTTYYPDAKMLAAKPKFYWHWRSDGSFHYRIKKPPVPEGKYRSVGGGIVSTLEDYATFLLMHQNGGVYKGRQIVPKNALREMYKRYPPGPYYGLGFTLGPPTKKGLGAWILHRGSSGTMCWLDFDRKMIGVLFTQSRRSRGKDMPESQKKIPKDRPSWQKIAKKRIDKAFIRTTFKSKRKE